MWNKKSLSKILEKRRKEEAHMKHKEKLQNMKSTINNSEPKHYQFLDTRPKAKQKQFQKNKQIQSNNFLLVKKMLTIQSHIHPKEAYFKNSLNSGLNKKAQTEISNNNLQLVKKLQSASSYYSTKNIKKSIKSYSRLKTNMVNSRMDPFYDLANYRKSHQIQKQRMRPFSAKK